MAGLGQMIRASPTELWFMPDTGEATLRPPNLIPSYFTEECLKMAAERYSEIGRLLKASVSFFYAEGKGKIPPPSTDK